MIFSRISSIVFYILIAFSTCFLARKIVGTNGMKKYSIGRSSRAVLYNKTILTAIFSILFICSALRYGIGNDYMQYIQTAHEAYVGGYVVTEFGFNWLVRIVYTLCGFECYELVFAIFAAVTIGVFLKAMYEQSANFAFSFFLFMMLGFYFQTFNTVRYYLALAITLYSVKYIIDENKKDWIKFIFLILVAAAFHKSVLLVIPVYFIATYKWKNWQIILGLILSSICYLGRNIVLKIALVLYPSYKNTIYLEGGISKSSLIRLSAIMFIYLFFIWNKGKNIINAPYYRKITFYGQLNILAFAVGVFFSFLPVVTRIIYYFSVTQILMLPMIIENLEDEKIKKIVKNIAIVACILYFILFLLQAHKDGVGLLPYSSIIWETR